MDFAVLFDMDGVIVDSNPYHRLALDRFFEKYGISLSEDDLKNMYLAAPTRTGCAMCFRPRPLPRR